MNEEINYRKRIIERIAKKIAQNAEYLNFRLYRAKKKRENGRDFILAMIKKNDLRKEHRIFSTDPERIYFEVRVLRAIEDVIDKIPERKYLEL